MAVLFPRITVDYTRCTVPMACKKCLKACPEVVFTARAAKMERGKETNPREPGAYKLDAARRDKCTVCGKCLEVCPVAALTVTPAQEVRLG